MLCRLHSLQCAQCLSSVKTIHFKTIRVTGLDSLKEYINQSCDLVLLLLNSIAHGDPH